MENKKEQGKKATKPICHKLVSIGATVGGGGGSTVEGRFLAARGP